MPISDLLLDDEYLLNIVIGSILNKRISLMQNSYSHSLSTNKQLTQKKRESLF
ncbi:hypothetical protein JCM18900_11140 [Psychrobacter sp. JCM 18900]|nr:hypothetical protein JCM18900_11140 [Psychrobacter sp. JCM 18900]